MATASNLANFGPEWCAREVVTFAGALDSHISTGEDYETRTLASIFTMEPGKAAKGEGLAFIPSAYHDFDARNHARQREIGQFVALTGDIDGGDHALTRIESLVRGFCGDAAWLIYSSAHARPGDMRWRVVIPLATPLAFDDWHDAQHSFFDYMEYSDVEMDRALDRAGQPVYLPNVPDFHAKSGDRLRGEDGKPLYYVRSTTGCNAQGIDHTAGVLAQGISDIRRQRAVDERERERIRREAEQRRANKPRGEGAPIIEDFNRENSIASLLELYGYEQSPRHSEDWRSPLQNSDSYATRIVGDKWISLSGSDAGARIGETFKGGCFGDAYDLFVHFEHGGDHKSAFRALYSERRANSPQPGHEPPPQDESDPGWTEPPEGIDEAAEPILAAAEAEPAEVEHLNVFHPADWEGSEPPVRVWRWANFIPDMQATLITGAGASGKSLATQQMATCIAMGLPFLGVPTNACPSLYITCEDDLDELHRRQAAINEALGVKPAETRDRLLLVSLQGEVANELATFTSEGEMTIARRFDQIARTCLDRGLKHVTIDNTAHTFAGNENDRHQVAAFVNLNNRLAQIIGGSVLMVGHPNKAGDSYSGSTAWENQVRSRLYLEVPRGVEGEPIDPDMRVIRNEKANYSQRGAEVRFLWHRGAFVLEDAIPQGNERDMRESAQAASENEIFLRLLDTLTQQRRQVSHAPNVPTYAPKIMSGMPEAKGLGKANLARAMERLFGLGEIVASQALWLGPDRHPVVGLARKGHEFQGRRTPRC